MKTEGHERKEETKCVKGEKDEKGNKWRRRKPMSPNLIRNLGKPVEQVRAVCAPEVATGPNGPENCFGRCGHLCRAKMAGCFDHYSHVTA